MRIQPGEIVFTGVGKTRDELTRAISLGVSAINAESPGEVDRIADIASALKTTARIAVRINPDVDAGSHPHISTGHRATKFGMSSADAAALLRTVSRRPSLKAVGLHVHIGSQITRTEPLAAAAREVAGLASSLKAEGIALEHVDIGGGLGIAYEPGQAVVSAQDYASAVLPAVGGLDITLVLEPGRWLVGPAGVLLTSVVDIKAQATAGQFVIVDAGIDRPASPRTVRGLACDRSGGATDRAHHSRGNRRARLRDQRHARSRPGAFAGGSGRPSGCERRRGVRSGDGVELQSTSRRG